MKIHERETAVNIQKPLSGTPVDPVKPGRKSVSPDKPFESREDQVDLDTGNQLLSLARNLGGEERANRVEKLRQLVQSGQYQVDPVALSSALIDAAIQGY